jgi:small subunit ribosomal protein S6
MALYETVFIARQDITSAQVDALATTFGEIVTAHGGTVIRTESWGLKTLAYRIKKNRKGHYVLFQLDAPHAAIAELERNMGLNEDVLRFMTLRVEQHEAEPSVMMQSKGDRNRDYERRRDYEDRETALVEEIQV